jgi:hypothetical protein
VTEKQLKTAGNGMALSYWGLDVTKTSIELKMEGEKVFS